MPASQTASYSSSARRRAAVMARGGKGTPPSITGAMILSSLLTADVGTWVPSDASVEYQWWLGREPIAGGTAATHTVTAADLSLNNLHVSILVTSPSLGLLPVGVRAPYVG